MNLFLHKSLVIFTLLIYTLSLVFIFLYSMIQAHIMVRYIKHKKNSTYNKSENGYFPHVTIQLPIYNELYVVERLIDSVASLDYPKDKLEIQVLDDSTDETVQIIQKKVEYWIEKGMDIIHIKRKNRNGFKAGALKYGLQICKGDFIAIFDADFVPRKDFLNRTLHHFNNLNIGMVQTRWAHINKNYSILTKMQAFALDAHFTIEQVGRNSGGSFINFNGTGGIWRKECIVDAGNWEGDTLTEDLDLSYRAQMKGWKFKYLEDCESPAELPPLMSAIKSQQYRWTKGGAENARKHLLEVLKSGFGSTVKWHAAFHLLNSTVFVAILLAALSSVPLLFMKLNFPIINDFFNYGSIFLLSFIIIGLFYYTASKSMVGNKTSTLNYFLKTYPAFLSISMGLSLHNGIAVIEGLLGKKTPFIRTPKFNIEKNKNSLSQNIYIRKEINWLSILEALLAVYFLFGLVSAIFIQDFSLIVFHAMLTFGFGMVAFHTFFQKFLIRIK